MTFGRVRILVLITSFTLVVSSMWAQDLGPHFRKIKEGIYVQSAREVNSNSGIILTKEAVVIIDTGQTPTDSREVEAAVRKLTALPVRVVINTEVHGEAAPAAWRPNERVLFASSVAIPDSINNLRPFVAIPEMLTTIKMLKSLNPEVVVPGHGSFGTTKIFDDSERYYGLLLERVGAMVRAGKSLDQIKQELRMPEYKDWSYQERMPTNIEAAYRAVKGAKAP